MIDTITSIEYDTKVWPLQVRAYVNKAIVKTWEFYDEAEAYRAASEIWQEVISAKRAKGIPETSNK